MKLADELSNTGQAGCKTVTVEFKGIYHLTAMGTDAVIRERKKSALEGDMELDAIKQDAVKKGMDPEIVNWKCASIDAEI